MTHPFINSIKNMSIFASLNRKVTIQPEVKPVGLVNFINPRPIVKNTKIVGFDGKAMVIRDFITGKVSGIPGCRVSRYRDMLELSIGTKLVAFRTPSCSTAFAVRVNGDAVDEGDLSLIEKTAKENGIICTVSGGKEVYNA